MASVPVFLVDAFASKPFTGNPAAVCLLEESRESSWMQSVAAEMNLSETAFLHPDNGQLRLRWFTPAVEVDLCGHATLAVGHVLRTLADAGTQTVTIHLFDNLGLAVADFQGSFCTFYNAQPTTVTFFLINFYNIPHCHNAPPLMF